MTEQLRCGVYVRTECEQHGSCGMSAAMIGYMLVYLCVLHPFLYVPLNVRSPRRQCENRFFGILFGVQAIDSLF